MDFLDPQKKQAHKKRLFLGYFFIGAGILLGSLILVFQAYGFDVDRKTGDVIQNGLIFTASYPETSNIFLNGSFKGETDKRLVVPAGPYSIELKRDGYRTWKRSFELEGSSIERLTYPLLIPEKLTTKDRKSYETLPGFSTQSPDRRWIIIAQPGTLTSFDVIDANNPKSEPKTISLPTSILTTLPGSTQSLQLVEWSTDNRHVLLKHSYNQSFEYIMLDRSTPENSLNINKQLNSNPTFVTLRDKKHDQLFLYDAQTKLLSTANVNTKEISAFISNVLTHKTHGQSTVLYSTPDTKSTDTVNVYLRDNKKDIKLRTASIDEVLKLDLARYDSSWYIAVGASKAGKVYIYRDPIRQEIFSDKQLPKLYVTLKIDQFTNVSFSANTRFIMAQNANQFAVYDAETDRRYSYGIDALKLLPNSSKAEWMDGHRIVASHNGFAYMFDYDGVNIQKLVPIVSDSKPFFDQKYQRLYTIAPSVSNPQQTALSQTNLKLNLK